VIHIERAKELDDAFQQFKEAGNLNRTIPDSGVAWDVLIERKNRSR